MRRSLVSLWFVLLLAACVFAPLSASAQGTVDGPADPPVADPEQGQTAGVWTVVSSPGPYALASVTMVAPDDGWIVGYESRSANGTPIGQVILRWNGSAWTRVTSPTSFPLLSASAASASDIWAAGASWSQMMRWNGSAWSTASFAAVTRLNSVAMVSATDGWAVGGEGSCSSPGSFLKGSIIRWDGNTWSQWGGFLGDVSLYSVALGSSSDGWAVGRYCKWHEPPPPSQDSVIMRWNGTAWNEVNAPTGQMLNSVTVLSAANAWAVGDHGVILHWDGSTWNMVNSPTICGLNSVAMASADDGWAVGDGGYWCYNTPIILHWDGSSWSEVSSPATLPLHSVWASSEGGAWAVGDGGAILRYAPLVPLASVTIGGPMIGFVNTGVAFSAAVSPATATTPITYTWSPAPDSGQGTAVAIYSWGTAGEKTLSVTAENAGGVVSDEHAIAIVEPRHVYLPIALLRDADGGRLFDHHAEDARRLNTIPIEIGR